MKPQEDMLNKWVCTYEFPVDVILRACEICCQRLNRADFKYIDAILTSWNKDGLKTLGDIEAKDRKFIHKSRPKSYKGQNDNFNNFEQRVYDYDELEKKLLGWDK